MVEGYLFFFKISFGIGIRMGFLVLYIKIIVSVLFCCNILVNMVMVFFGIVFGREFV